MLFQIDNEGVFPKGRGWCHKVKTYLAAIVYLLEILINLVDYEA